MAIYSPLGHKESDTTEQLTHFPSAQSGKLGIWSKMNFLGHPFFFFLIFNPSCFYFFILVCGMWDLISLIRN